MRIVVAGGRNKADFLIGSLLSKHHNLTVINDEEAYCNYLSEKHNIPIIQGNPCKRYVLDEADIYDADILIALRPSDADNLIICQYAKRIFHVARVAAIVSNPRNVQVFKRLGVDTAISATYTISKIIEQASTVKNLVNTLSIEPDRIVLNEILLTNQCGVINHRIKDLFSIPKHAIICCILRNIEMIVPNGDTILKEHDKLLVLCDTSSQDLILQYFTGRQSK